MRIKSSNRALWSGRHGSRNERSQDTRTAKNGFSSFLGSARIQQVFVKVSDTTQRDAEDLFQLPHLLLLLMVMLKTTWFPVNSEHPRHMSLIKGGSILAFFVIVSISFSNRLPGAIGTRPSNTSSVAPPPLHIWP